MTDVLQSATTSVGYEKGFSDQRSEIVIDSLEVEGTLPTWLSGTLIRNGPARFHLEDKTLNHWFDGLGMLHKFDIVDGRVSFANRYLDSPARRADEEGAMAYSEFATDPCRSLFKRFTTLFTGASYGANANITTGRIGDQFVAQMESPMPVAFDPQTLDTIGVVSFEDELKGEVTTAHPHHDPAEQASYNFLLKFGVPSSTYDIYRLPDGSKTREVLGRAGTRRPSYVHSVGFSERYVIVAEFPLVVNPLRLMLSGRPFIENYRWEPERGTRFTLVDRRTGHVSHAHTDEAWFGFHHVNAVDREGEDGVVDLDILVYPTAEVVQHYYLTSVLDRPNHNVYPPSELRRFTVAATTGRVQARTLVHRSSELPRINYAFNTKPYRYMYANGVGTQGESVFLDTIIKADVTTGDVQEWRCSNHFPGEPVFIPRPHADAEDDGVLLTVVLDAARNTSYLLVLDATDLTEIARAHVPQHVPFGFHGTFTRTGASQPAVR